MIVDLNEARREFWEAWNGLSEVHTQKDLESQSENMWAARRRLLKVDPEFRAMIKDRENKANEEADEQERQIKNRHRTITSEAEAKSQGIVLAAEAKASAAMRMSESDLDEWVQKKKFKILTSEEAKNKSKLVCPICRGSDRRNILNEKPSCLECMHVLVPEDELKNYNRDYRRRWKRKRAR